MQHRKRRVGILLVLAFLAGLITACTPYRAADEPSPYYSGEVRRITRVVAGPLQLTLWRVTYEAGHTKLTSGTTFIMPPRTSLDLWLKNAGGSPVVVEGTTAPIQIPPGAEPPAPPPYYLIDEVGRPYPATGNGWTRFEGDAPEQDGKALPGKTVEFSLGFDGIPQSVKALTLVMENLRTEAGARYDLRLPVPLPGRVG